MLLSALAYATTFEDPLSLRRMAVKATGGPELPLVPGFPVTLISRCFIGTV